MANFVPITWGQIRLWCSDVSTNRSRRVIIHDLTQGNVHPTYDAGDEPKITRCTLLFDEFPGESDDPKVRLQKLETAVSKNEPAIFTHPLFGSWSAIVGQFQPRIDAHGVCSAEIEFIPSEGAEKVSPVGAGIPGVAGEASVTAAADALDFELETVFDEELLGSAFAENPIDITAAAREAVESWNEGEEVPTRDVITDTADLSSRLSTMIDDMGMEDDLALFDIYRATIMMGESVRAAAIAATSETPAVFVMRVKTPVVLLRLCAQTYGGAEAEDRERQVRALNDIQTAGWFGPGDLLMPVKGSSRAAI